MTQLESGLLDGSPVRGHPEVVPEDPHWRPRVQSVTFEDPDGRRAVLV